MRQYFTIMLLLWMMIASTSILPALLVVAFTPIARWECDHGYKFRMSSRNGASSNDLTTALEEQLKAVEGRNEAIQSYLHALEEEEKELNRVKAEMIGTSAATKSIIQPSIVPNKAPLKRIKEENDNDHSNETSTITFTNHDYHNLDLVLGGGLFASVVGLRQFLQERPVKQQELQSLKKNDSCEVDYDYHYKNINQTACELKVVGIGTGGSNVIQQLHCDRKEHDNTYDLVQVQESDLSNVGNSIKKDTSKNIIQTLTIDTCNDAKLSKREQIQNAINKSKKQLSCLLKDAKVIVCALEASDLFSSIASYATVQETANIHNALSIYIVSTAFPFEGDKRTKRSKKTIDTLKHFADMTVIIPSHVILDTVSKDTPIKTVYSIVDDIISHGVTSLIHLIVDKTKDSSIRIWNSTNLNNLENWFQNSNCFGSMGIGKGEGPNAAVDAVLSAIAYPTFGEIHFQVKSILCTIQGGPNMTQKDVRACEENLYQCFGPVIQVFISAYKDENLKEDAVTVVIIALNH